MPRDLQEGRPLIWVVLSLAFGQDAARGELLAGLGGCASCHTSEDGVPYAGGYAVETRFGTFYGSNLTTLQDWSLDDFITAMRRGVGPDGRPYYPAFPYTSFTLVTDDDLADLWAYLQTLPPSPQEPAPHEVRKRYRGRLLLGLWRTVSFRDRSFQPEESWTPEETRGAYLVQGLGHCGECHTPRTSLGKLRHRRALTGSRELPHPGPDLTTTGWSADAFADYLEMGLTPDGDFAGGSMYRVIEEGTARLSEEDRRAIAAYLYLLAEPE